MSAKTRDISWRLDQDPNGGLMILTITEMVGVRNPKRVRSYYRVERNPNSPTAFRLHKVVHSDEDPILYDVQLKGRNKGCSCMGGESHPETECKHRQALRCLVEDGEL